MAWHRIITAIAVTLVASATYAADWDKQSTLYFAAGWRTNAPAPGNVVQLGSVYRCGSGWCMDHESYPGIANLPLKPLAVHHEMHAPIRDPRCVDGPLKTVDGKVTVDENVKMSSTPAGLEVQTPDVRYLWKPVDSAAGVPRYELASIQSVQAGVNVDQIVGVAFNAERAGSIKSLDMLDGRYDGAIFHKDARATPQNDWKSKSSSVDFAKFKPTNANPRVWGFTQESNQAEVERRIGKELWVQHSLYLMEPKTPRLRYILHEYGHDFAGRGCFDMPGHNKLMLPVVQADRVPALVYIEYTPDQRDHIPMLSVGSYFERNRPAAGTGK